MQSQAKAWSGAASAALPNFKLTTFKDLVRKGVPLESRPRVWFAMGSGASLRELASSSYENICSGDIPTDAQISIDQDIANTFRQHQLFHSKAGVEALRRVLTAFAHYNQGSYSRGSAHIAGLLLIIMGVEQEEEAFWTMISLLHFRMYPYSAGQVSSLLLWHNNTTRYVSWLQTAYLRMTRQLYNRRQHRVDRGQYHPAITLC
jgi:hypothetical protein